jgi:hypothetical protein
VSIFVRCKPLPPALASFALFVLALACAPLAAQQGGTPSTPGPNGSTIPVARIGTRTGEISIDGRIEEAAWQAAPLLTDFVQSEPLDGDPATVETEVRVLLDGDALGAHVRRSRAHRACAQSSR